MNKISLVIVLLMATLLVAMNASAICVCNNHYNCTDYCNGGDGNYHPPTTSSNSMSHGGHGMKATFIITKETINDENTCIEGFQRKYDYYHDDGAWHKITIDYPTHLMSTCINKRVFHDDEWFAYNRYGGMLGVMFDKTIYHPLEATI